MTKTQNAPAEVTALIARIRSLYWMIAEGEPQTWVKISDIAGMLDYPEATMAAAWTALERENSVHLVPIAAQWELADYDRATAAVIAGEPKHLIAIDHR